MSDDLGVLDVKKQHKDLILLTKTCMDSTDWPVVYFDLQQIQYLPSISTHCKIVGLCLLLIGSTLGKGKFWGTASPRGLM